MVECDVNVPQRIRHQTALLESHVERITILNEHLSRAADSSKYMHSVLDIKLMDTNDPVLPPKNLPGLSSTGRDQFCELVFGGFNALRTFTNIGQTGKMGAQVAARNDDSESLASVAGDDLRDVCDSGIDLFHLPIELLLNLVQVVLWRFDFTVVSDADV